MYYLFVIPKLTIKIGILAIPRLDDSIEKSFLLYQWISIYHVDPTTIRALLAFFMILIFT